MNAAELRLEKARQLRYKRPMCSEMNYDTIRERLEEMISDCENIRYIIGTHDENSALDALEDALGDRDEAMGFMMDFSTLATNLQQMSDDYFGWEQPIEQDDFDALMVAVSTGSSDTMLGFDTEVEDYFRLGIGFETQMAIEEGQKKIMRLTKKQLIDAMQVSMHLVTMFTTLCYRFDCLKASVDIIMDRFGSTLRTVDEIEKLYERVKTEGHSYDDERQFEKLCRELPDEAWLQ